MTSALQALLKQKHGRYINPLAGPNTIAEFAPMVEATKIGDTYEFPIRMGVAGGVTFDDTKTAFSLGSGVNATKKRVSVPGSSIAMVQNVSYDDMFATSGSTGDGQTGVAYMSAVEDAIEDLMLGSELYREVTALYGPGPSSTLASSLGTVSASVSGANLAAPQVVNITRATWAPGMWPVMQDHEVDIYQSDLASVRAASVTIQAVGDTQNRLTLYKSGSSAVVAAGDVIVARSQLDVSSYGLQAIGANTGTLFGINASTYAPWMVTPYDAAGNLNRDKILRLCARLQGKGAKDGGRLFVSGPCMADLIAEATELQRFNDTMADMVTQGASSVKYKTPIGVVDVVVHTYMKQGIAFLLPNGAVKRPGSTDVTFRDPTSMSNDYFVQQLASNAGIQLRTFQSWGIVIEKPWHSAYITGIQSDADTTPA